MLFYANGSSGFPLSAWECFLERRETIKHWPILLKTAKGPFSWVRIFLDRVSEQTSEVGL